jgi:hypothetical protein
MAYNKYHTTIFSIREKFQYKDESYFSLLTTLKEKQLYHQTLTNTKGQPVIWWFKKVRWCNKDRNKDKTIKWLTHMLKTQYSFTWSYQDVNDDIQELGTLQLLETYHLTNDLY